MVYANDVLRMVLFYVMSCVLLSPGAPFYSPRGGLGLQDVGARVGLDRGMALVNSRLLYQRALDWSCCSVLGDDGACIS